MKRVLILFFIVFTPLIITAQEFTPTPVEISKEKVNIKGSYYYVHKVLAGQTLYSISKVYGVSLETLIGVNPDLSQGLKGGTLIYIPVINNESIVAVSARNTKELQQELTTAEKRESEETKYKQHTVRWYENIDDIAHKYGISLEALIALNKLGENPVLKRKQILLIPDKNYTIITDNVEVMEAEPAIGSANDTLNEKNQGSLTDKERGRKSTTQNNTTLYKYNNRTYKISLVLPFNTSPGTDNANVNHIDFYSGTLLAMKDMKEKAVGKFTLNVVNMNDYLNMSDMINSGILEGSELIIGPVMEKDLADISRYAEKKRIPIISPMDHKAEILAANNPFFFQFPVSNETVMEGLVNQLKDKSGSNSNVLIIAEKGTESSPLVTSTLSRVKNNGISYDSLSYGILQGRVIDEAIVRKLSNSKLNKVLVVSESEAFVNDVLRNLHVIANRNVYTLEVYGMPKWKNFEIIELEYFHRLNLHLSLQYFIDYNDPKTKDFVSNYWETFNTEPTPFSFQGYDIVTYFVSALSEYGREFPIYINGYSKTLLQSSVNFVNNKNRLGFENQSTSDIVYVKNWGIKRK